MSHFTKAPNTLWDNGWFRYLNKRQVDLVMAIVRLSIGYQREVATVGETQLLEMTGLKRATLYLAKQELTDAGLIEVGREGQKCTYRVLFDADPSKILDGSEKLDGSKNSDGKGPKNWTDRGPKTRTGSILQENLKESTKQSVSSTAFAPDRDDDEFPVLEMPGDAQAHLAGQLRAENIDERTVREMLQNPSKARDALKLAQGRQNVQKRAGFIVAVYRNGIFPAPEPQRVVLEPPAPPEMKPSRHAVESAREQAHRDAEQVRARRDWEHLAGQADQAELAAAEAFARANYKGAMAKASAEAPHIHAMMLEYLRARASPKQQVS